MFSLTGGVQKPPRARVAGLVRNLRIIPAPAMGLDRTPKRVSADLSVKSVF